MLRIDCIIRPAPAHFFPSTYQRRFWTPRDELPPSRGSGGPKGRRRGCFPRPAPDVAGRTLVLPHTGVAPAIPFLYIIGLYSLFYWITTVLSARGQPPVSLEEICYLRKHSRCLNHPTICPQQTR